MTDKLLTPQQHVVAVATAMLRGELGIIEGSRLISGLRSRVSSIDHDPDFIPFVAIDSETDHLPVGDVRRHWAADALACKDTEIQAAEEFHRADAFVACRLVLERFSSTPNGQIRDA